MNAEISTVPVREDTFWCEITATVSADYRQRGVFSDLLSGPPVRRAGPGGANLYFNITASVGQRIRSDAAARLQEKELPRGKRIAFKTLFDYVNASVNRIIFPDIEPDQGPREAERVAKLRSAALQVGAVVTYTHPSGAAVNGVIQQGFATHAVYWDSGPYYDDTGRRITYRPGYIIKISGENCFAAPWQLSRARSKVGHMRLVVSN